eukprot:m.155215 g.155215  ORF g.155215 m.155215 type:complete len:522 (-) comp16408_c0_seq4:190-1755(-)
MAAKNVMPWHQQEATNVHFFFIREDIETQRVLLLLHQAVQQHGLIVSSYDVENGQIEFGSTDEDLKFPGVLKSGRHPIKGNMIVLEWTRFDADKAGRVAAGIMVALVVVVVLAAIGAAASGGSHHGGSHHGGSHHGGSGHHGRHCHSHSSNTTIIYAGGYNGGGSSRRHQHQPALEPRRLASSSFGNVDYSQVGMTAVPLATSRIEELRAETERYTVPIKSCDAYKSRKSFFNTFATHLAAMLYNHGLARVPCYDDRLKITPVSLNESLIRSASMPAGRTHIFCYDVTPEAARGAFTSLQLELTFQGSARLACRHDNLPNWWSQSTVTGTPTGANMAFLQLIQPKPGRYYISVSNASSRSVTSYTLAAGWFDKSNDGDRDHSLLGSTVRFDATNDKAQRAMPGAAAVAQDDDDDDWELVDVDEQVEGVLLSKSEMRGCDPITAGKGKLYHVTSMDTVAASPQASIAATPNQRSYASVTAATAPPSDAPPSDAPPAYQAYPGTGLEPSAPLPAYEEIDTKRQ